jgi:hypothetical protein
MVAGVYKITLTEALKIETHIWLINITLKDKVARIMLRISASHARYVINKKIKKIRQQIHSKRGK